MDKSRLNVDWYLYQNTHRHKLTLNLHAFNDIGVPDRRRRVVPKVVLVRRWVIGMLGIEGGGFGEGVGSGEVSVQAT
jgi:hypothetical protein